MRLGQLRRRHGDAAPGEATRRMVDLSLVLDVSSSIGSTVAGGARCGAGRSSTRSTQDNDRLSLVTYGNGARVLDQMPSQPRLQQDQADQPTSRNTLPGGSTTMVEGLYRGWDELRTVPRRPAVGPSRHRALHRRRVEQRARQLRRGRASRRACGRTTSRRTCPDPDGQTWNNPQIAGLFDTETGAAEPRPTASTVANWN